MSSPFAAAIMESMTANLDPMNGLVSKYAQQTLDTQAVQLVTTKADTIAHLEQLFTTAKDRGADATVITAYQKLLTKLTS